MQAEPAQTSWRRVRIPLAAGGIALALQVAYVLSLPPDALNSLHVIRDALYYDMRASEIASGDLLGSTAEYLSPLYCLTLALFKLVSLESPAAMKLGQALLVAAAAALVSWLAQRHFGEPAAALAGAGYALYPAATYYGAEILPTSLVVLVNLLVLALYPVEEERAPPGRLLALGFVAGLSALAKANALLLVVVLALGHLVAARGRSPGRAWRGAALILLGAAIAITPVTIKNALVSKRFVLITTSGGVNLLKGNGPRATGTHVFLERRADTRTGLRAHLRGIAAADPGVSVDQARGLGDDALAFMRENPRRTLRLFLRKLGFFWHDRELVIKDDLPAARRARALLAYPFPGYGLLVALAASALLLIRWRRPLWPLLALLAVQAASFTLVFVLARYRLVSVALLFVLAAGGWARVPGLWRERARGRLGAALAAALLVATLALWPRPEPRALPADDGTAPPVEELRSRL